MVADDETPAGVFIGIPVYFFSLKARDGISRILSSARSVGEGMAGIRAISSSLIARPFHERIQSGDKTTKNVEA